MTEQEWLACMDAANMLACLQGQVSDRKCRLFAVATCRKLFPLLHDQHSRRAVRTAERYADGEVGSDKLRYAWGSARRAAQITRRCRREDPPTAQDSALWAVTLALEVDLRRLAGLNITPSWHLPPDMKIDQASLWRDLVGPLLYRPVTVDPCWRTATVIALAQAIYTDRAFDRMPILADALEEAGCTSADILDHCRLPGEHVRGCWVVDLLLGKQ